MAAWHDLLADLEREAAAAVIACTDLNAVTDGVKADIAILDASAALAEAAVDREFLLRKGG